jgi:predicted Zn-dependent protease
MATGAVGEGWRSRSTSSLALAIACGVALSGCSNVKEARAQADAATRRFHERFNNGEFAAIYASADPDFRNASTAQGLEAFLKPYRAQLGSFQHVAHPGVWTLNWTPSGTFVTLTEDGTFNHGAAQEMFLWRVGKTTSTLVKYTINNVNVPQPVPVATTARPARPIRFMPFHASLAHLEYLRRYYREQLDLEIEVLPELVADRAAWSPVRRQWSAEGLAEQVRQSVGNIDALTIGITGDDIYLRSVNWQYAFGWRADNRIAIVSYAKMDPQFFNGAEDADLLHRRMRHMVTKDLGLMFFGLHMSPDRASPMYEAIGGLEELDAMGEDLGRAGFSISRR